VLEILSAFAVEPTLARLFGKNADLSDFRPLVGNAKLLLVVLAATGSSPPSARSSCTAAT